MNSNMEKKQYKISVIVPVYNTEQYLEQCIDSIILQSYKNIELILADDGSTDNSAAICDRYAGQDDRIRVIHKKNEGPTMACAAGIKIAKGRYFMFVDSDDYLDVKTLEQMSRHLNGTKGEVVCCNHILEKQRATIQVSAQAKPGVYEGQRLQKEIKDKLFGNEERLITASRCMKLCERSIFDGNEKYYDPSVRMGDDLHMMFPALLNSQRIVIMKDAFYYHYRYVENSLVHKYDEAAMENLNAWYRSLQRVAEDKKVPDGKKMADREYCYMLIYVMKNELRNPDKDYVSKIREIFCDQKLRERIWNTPITVKARSSQLLYLGMRYPEKALLRILRFIIKMYDRKSAKQKV